MTTRQVATSARPTPTGSRRRQGRRRILRARNWGRHRRPARSQTSQPFLAQVVEGNQNSQQAQEHSRGRLHRAGTD